MRSSTCDDAFHLNDYVFTIEDLRNGDYENIYGTRLKFYSDASLNKKVIYSKILSSENGTPVSCLLRLHEDDKGELFVGFRWKGLSKKHDTI